MAFKCTKKHQDCHGRCEEIDCSIDFLKTLNDENRLRIICVLSNTKGFTVNQIVEGVELPQNLVSHHLKAMHARSIVNREKQGLHVYYSLNQTKIDQNLNSLKKLLNN